MTVFQHNKYPIISLTTDFGRSDGYVGTMEGVILTICPPATITHLTHQIPPQDIHAAAFVLYQSFSYYPLHAVHCVVVDPGVGSKRRAVAIRTDHGTFVGPDNGVFSLVLNATNVQEAVTLTNTDYQLNNISATFHGRDIFAPAAAHIAAGVPLNRLGPAAINLVRLDSLTHPSNGQSRVIHVDHFGNVILSLTANDVPDHDELSLRVGNTVVKSLSYTFADVEEGQLLAYVGSSQDHIEIAMRNGNAAKSLGLQPGDVVQIENN